MTTPDCDLFRNVVNVPGKVFVDGHDVWSLYHCRMGELHCESEAERAIPVHPQICYTLRITTHPTGDLPLPRLNH